MTTVRLTIETVGGKKSFGWRPLDINRDGGEPVLASRSSNPQVREQRVFRRSRTDR